MICGRHQNRRVTATKKKKEKNMPYPGTFILVERFNPDCVGSYITLTYCVSDTAESPKACSISYSGILPRQAYSYLKFAPCTYSEFGGTLSGSFKSNDIIAVSQKHRVLRIQLGVRETTALGGRVLKRTQLGGFMPSGLDSIRTATEFCASKEES